MIDNRRNRPRDTELPKYIIMDAHDGEGNSRPVKFINEYAIDMMRLRIKDALDELNKYALMEGKDGQDGSDR